MDKVLVIFGSMSKEHDISCISAYNVLENIDKSKYIVSKLGITKDGKWYIYDGENSNLLNNKWEDDISKKQEVLDILNTLKQYDVVFPCLHGKYGEDGTIQGLLEMAKVNYVGCNVLGSSIGINKIISKQLVENENIKLVDYISLSIYDFNKQDFDLNELKKSIKEKLDYPIVIKPYKEGSSYGIKKVENEDLLLDAIKSGFEFDTQLLIEKYIVNRQEVECAVIEDKVNNTIHASTVGEISYKSDMYDFDTKYERDRAKLLIPASINTKTQEKIKEYSKRIFKRLNLSQMARVDFFVSGEQIYFNEVNTIPGFTNTSMYPMLLMYDNISYKEILNILIEGAKYLK